MLFRSVSQSRYGLAEIFIFTSFFIDTANIIVFFVSAEFSDIYLLFLTLIGSSIFKPPWRLNGDRVTGSA